MCNPQVFSPSYLMAHSLLKTKSLQELYGGKLSILKGVFLAALLISATASPYTFAAPASLPSKPRYGGTLHLGHHQKPAPLDPFNVTDTISAPLIDLIFNKLVRVKPSGEFEPDLAERWEISEDGLTYTFYLRRGVKFHNGQECTAKDVLYSLQLKSDKKISPDFSKQFERVKEWKAPSDYVFQAILKEPFSPFLVSLWRGSIIPKASAIHSSADLRKFAKSPIGTGPFIFEKQEQDGAIHLKGNGNYFEGRPYLDKVHIHIFSSKGQVWSAFLRGEIDIAFYLDRNDYKEIAANSSFRIAKALAPGGYMLLFNFKNKLLANEKIREAISLSINHAEILEKIEDGEGIIVNGPFHPNSWAYDLSIPTPKYDAFKASELLHAEGFTLRENIFEKDGNRLVLNLLINSENEHFMRIAKMIRQQLQEIGIAIQIQPFSNYQDLHSRVYHPDSNFQIYLAAFNNIDPDPDVVSQYFTGGSFNLGNYENSKVAHYFAIARETADLEKRGEIYKKINEIVFEEKPAIFLYIPYVFHATSNEISAPNEFFGPFISFYLTKLVFKKLT